MSVPVTIFPNFSRVVLTVCCSFIVAISSQAQPYNQLEDSRESIIDPVLVKEYYIEENGILSVFTISGDIDVSSVADTRKIRIELYADRGFSLWSQGNPLENYRVTNVKRGNEVSTSVEPKSKQKSSFWGPNTAFSYKITVPRYLSTNLKTLNGSVTIANVEGDHMIKSNAGDIQVHDINGMLKAYTKGGNIEVEHSKGTIYARADGGNIITKGIVGELRLRIHGGTVRSSNISGSMVAEVNAGDIEARFDQVDEGINLQTNAGNIHLIVPKSAGYGLYARGSLVRFDEPGIGIFEGTYSNDLADGSINGGGTPLSLTANAGRVTIQLEQ